MQPEPQRLGDPGCPLSLAPNQFLRRDFPGEFASWLLRAALEDTGAQVCLGFPVFAPKESGVNSLGMKAALPWACRGHSGATDWPFTVSGLSWACG